MAPNAVVGNGKRRSTGDFKGRHFAARLIVQAIASTQFFRRTLKTNRYSH